MKKYDTYKDSGIEWIGEIPLEWDLVNMKYLLKAPLKYGANESAEIDNPNLPRYIRITDFDENGKLREETFKSLPFEKAEGYMLEEGDILFARSGATVGKTFQFKNYDGQACFAGYLIKASPDEEKVLSDYLYFYTQSNSYLSWKDSIFNQATIQNIGADKYKDLKIVFPSLFEQAKIVSFLDHKTIQIDTLIEKKEQLVEKLTLKRQAIINEAVTKGLNPNVPMKDSGIEWLGEIPEHWEVVKFRHLIDILTDFTANGSFGDLAKNVTYIEEGYSRLIRLTDLRVDLLNKGVYLSEESHNYLSKSELFGGEVLLANVGAYSGLAWLMPYNVGKASLGPNMLLLKFKDQLDNKYAYHAMISKYLSSQFKLKAISAAQPKINKEDVRSCIFILPPKKEQMEINIYLDSKDLIYNSVTEKLEIQIAKLKLYRQSLISEAVTGKIDLRDWKQTDNK